jgi:hypothetical protein
MAGLARLEGGMTRREMVGCLLASVAGGLCVACDGDGNGGRWRDWPYRTDRWDLPDNQEDDTGRRRRTVPEHQQDDTGKSPPILPEHQQDDTGDVR